MTQNDLFYTRTMAKVYIDQGNLLKAAEIYRYLLESEPERTDLKDELSEIEKKLNEKSPDDLTRLFSRQEVNGKCSRGVHSRFTPVSTCLVISTVSLHGESNPVTLAGDVWKI